MSVAPPERTGAAPAPPSPSAVPSAFVPTHAAEAVKRAGVPLPAPVRHRFEPLLGQPLGHVQVHADSVAARSAQRVGADAYALGPHVVFGAGNWNPEGQAGGPLLHHELAHVVESPAAERVLRRPDPKAAAQLSDPVAANGALPGYGFFAVGPEFSAQPGLADAQKILVETGIADDAVLAKATVREHVVRNGDLRYFAFTHPTLGVVARAGTALAGYDGKGSRTPFYGVQVFLDESDAARLRPVGGTGERRSPIGLANTIADAPVLSYAALQADLTLLDLRLSTIGDRYATTVAPLTIAVAVARKRVADEQRNLTPDRPTSQRIETALQLVNWIDQDLLLMDRHREQLLTGKKPVRAIDALYSDYGASVQHLLDAGAMAEFERTQRQAERLPAREAIDTLRSAGGGFTYKGPLLAASDVVNDWSDDLRTRLDAMYERRDRGQDVKAEAEFLELGIRGLQLYTQRLVVFVQFWNARPGVLDTPLVDAMNRLRDQADAIKSAYDAGDLKVLRQRVVAMETDPNIDDFYRALPAAMQVTQLIARVGVTALAAIASGGVGGLLTRGATAAAEGITLRSAAAFVGTAALEALTFTTVNAAAGAALFGDKISLGSLLRDFAWNLGLFVVLKGIGGATGRVVRAMELEALSMPINVSVSFPFAHGWGLLRFRLENHRWPTADELDRMTAESLVMLAAIAVGSASVQRWSKANARARSISLIRAEYGWRLEALEQLRADLATSIQTADATGKGNDAAELAKARDRASKLEAAFRDILEQAIKDKRLDMKSLRKELNDLREQAPDVAARLMEDVLGVPAEAETRRAGPDNGTYTYANGKTSAVEDALAARGYRVTKATGRGGLKTISATAPDKPALTFQERSASLDFDTGLFDVRKLMIDLQITSPGAQKMLWRMLQDAGMTRDPVGAVGKTRQRVKELVRKAGKRAGDADSVLADLHQRGLAASGAPPELVKDAQSLRTKGILTSPEWIEARGLANQRGIVGEWLTREALPPRSGDRALRRVTVKGDLFEDAKGTVPAKDDAGAARVGVTIAETDLLYVSETGGRFQAQQALNVKASGESGMAASARQQNANFDAVLSGAPGDLVPIRSGKALRYARVASIGALDGTTTIDLTGRLDRGATFALDSVGPAKSGGFTKTLPLEKTGITTLTEILAEMQLIDSGLY